MSLDLNIQKTSDIYAINYISKKKYKVITISYVTRYEVAKALFRTEIKDDMQRPAAENFDSLIINLRYVLKLQYNLPYK